MSKITIIIPLYNAEKYLSSTFDCLKKQSFTDFEVLLVNDGSIDNTERICQDAVQSDSRFRYVYQSNQGVSAARNQGLALSKGEFITFMDADDNLPNHYLEALYSAAVSQNCPVSVCDVVILTGSTEIRRFTLPPQQLTQTQALNYLLTRMHINSGPCAKLFRKDLLEGIVFPPLKAYEDILFVVDVFKKCDRVAATDHTEYRYIQNEGSAMSTFTKMPSCDIVAATQKLLAFLAERTELDSACFYTTISHLMQYVIPLAKGQGSEAAEFILAARNVFKEHRQNIFRCPAFPWKEKIVYLLATYGWLYHQKKLIRI